MRKNAAADKENQEKEKEDKEEDKKEEEEEEEDEKVTRPWRVHIKKLESKEG
jgi:hypothetical protein